MNDHKRLASWRWAFALCLLGVLVMSLLPPSSSLPTTGWDKSNHLLAFAVLAWLSHRARTGRPVATPALLLAYGGLIELLQSLTPDREADLLDLLADGVGLMVGELVARLMAWQRDRRSAGMP
jgi:VanZ family protein